MKPPYALTRCGNRWRASCTHPRCADRDWPAIWRTADLAERAALLHQDKEHR